MKRILVTEEEVTFSTLIYECDNVDINIKDILQSIDSKFENYKTNVELINVSVSLLLNCSPRKDDCEGLDVENLRKLLDIISL